MERRDDAAGERRRWSSLTSLFARASNGVDSSGRFDVRDLDDLMERLDLMDVGRELGEALEPQTVGVSAMMK